MNMTLQILLIMCTIICCGVMFRMLKKETLDIKYSIVWIFAGVSLIIIAICPKIVSVISTFFGIIEPVNALYLIVIFFTLMICFSLTIALSRQSHRVKKMAQEIALLEKKLSNPKHNFRYLK